MTNDYQNNNIEQSNDNECSGNIKIRLPKTLHQILIDSAKNDGVSLNQYCVHILSDKMRLYMGREKFNRELTKIRNTSSDIDFEEISQNLESLLNRVNLFRELIKLEDFNTTNYLTAQDELDLEFKYPVLITRTTSRKFSISIKIPTIKMIIEPQNYDYKIKDRREIEDRITEINKSDNSFLMSIGNIDDINFTHSKAFDFKKTNSLVVNFLSEDLDTTKNKFYKISNELKKTDCIDQFLIKYSPAYLLKEIFENNYRSTTTQ